MIYMPILTLSLCHSDEAKEQGPFRGHPFLRSLSGDRRNRLRLPSCRETTSGVGVSSCQSHDVTNSALASKRNRTREAILSVFIFPPIFVPFASRFAAGTCDCVFRTRPTWILIGSWSIESQSSVEGSGLVVTAGPIITGESGFV